MGNRLNPGCNCCGCQSFELAFYPDILEPTPTCYVKERTVTETRVLVQEIFRDDSDDSETVNSTISDTTTYPETNTETTDSVMAAGRWTWEYPQDDPVIVDGDETAVAGGVTFERTTTWTTVTVEEERRLALLFDTSAIEWLDYLSPGSAHIEIYGSRYQRDNDPVFDGYTIDNNTSLYGAKNSALPADSSEFETMRLTLTSNHQFVFGNDSPPARQNIDDVTTWGIEQTNNLLFLVDEPDFEDTGMLLSDVRLAISVKSITQSGLGSDYNWRDDWESTAYGSYTSKRSFKTDGQMFDLTNLVTGLHFEDEDEFLKFELIDDSDVVKFTMTYAMEIPTTANATPDAVDTLPCATEPDDTWTYKLVSTGTCGDLDHRRTSITDTVRDAPSYVREESWAGHKIVFYASSGDCPNAVQVHGTTYFTNATIASDNSDTEFVKTLDPALPSSLRVRITIDDGDRNEWRPNVLTVSQVFDPVGDKRADCPDPRTCKVLDKRAPPRWKINSIALDSLPDPSASLSTGANCGHTFSLNGALQRATAFFWLRTTTGQRDQDYEEDVGGTTLTGSWRHQVTKYAATNHLSETVSAAYNATIAITCSTAPDRAGDNPGDPDVPQTKVSATVNLSWIGNDDDGHALYGTEAESRLQSVASKQGSTTCIYTPSEAPDLPADLETPPATVTVIHMGNDEDIGQSGSATTNYTGSIESWATNPGIFEDVSIEFTLEKTVDSWDCGSLPTITLEAADLAVDPGTTLVASALSHTFSSDTVITDDTAYSPAHKTEVTDAYIESTWEHVRVDLSTFAITIQGVQ